MCHRTSYRQRSPFCIIYRGNPCFVFDDPHMFLIIVIPCRFKSQKLEKNLNWVFSLFMRILMRVLASRGSNWNWIEFVGPFIKTLHAPPARNGLIWRARSVVIQHLICPSKEIDHGSTYILCLYEIPLWLCPARLHPHLNEPLMKTDHSHKE